MTSATQPERFDGQSVTAVTSARWVFPRAGKGFPGSRRSVQRSPLVVILSDALWRRRFGGDSTIVGRQISLDDNLYTVLGVMPRGSKTSWLPRRSSGRRCSTTQEISPALETQEWGHHLHLVGRLRPGLGVDQARRS